MVEMRITRLEAVGDNTLAIEVEPPSGFEAYPGQFVLIRATIDGEDETGYYTISSPNADETFEITVGVHPEGTLGPWLAERTLGETLTIEGPFGDITYTGDENALVFARGPGIGPAIGIAERAADGGRDATLVYDGDEPAHTDRLEELEATKGITLILSDSLRSTVETLCFSNMETYVFGFQGFVEETRDALETVDVDPADVEIESFGPA